MTGFVIGVVATLAAVWAWRKYDGWGAVLRLWSRVWGDL